MNASQIEQVRRLNRLLTRRIGAMSDDYLGRGRPLAESRLLFEIGADGADVRELRARLGIDSGYLSRLLRALEAQGLLRTGPSPADARVRRAVLTDQGHAERATLDQRSHALAASLLDPLDDGQRAQLVQAMATVERLLRAGAVTITVADPSSPAACACIEVYLRELDARFDTGFDATRSVSANPQELLPPNGVFVLAMLDDDAVGCGGLKVTGDGIGEIKRMWVAPDARGLGIARRLLATLERHAVDMGLHTVQLDTNRTLLEARALYARHGYVEIPPYNDNPYADHWFEKRLRGD